MASNTKDLKAYEVEALVEFFMYTMKWEQRSRLMKEFPTIYNTICGSKVVHTEVIDYSTQDEIE